MKICPKCGKENADNAKYCKYCGAKLEPREEDFEWTIILTAENQFEADVVKNLLEENGIDVMLKRPKAGITGSFMLANPLMGSAGAWDVYVARIDEKRAMEILSQKNILKEGENGASQDDNQGS